MMNFAFYRFTLLSATQATVQDAIQQPGSGYRYSIQAVFDWDLQKIRSLAGWGVKNAPSLLAGVVALALTVALCWGFLLLIRRVAAPILGKWHPALSGGLTALSKPVVCLAFLCGFSTSLTPLQFSAETREMLDKIFYVCFAVTFISIIQHALQCTASLLIARFKQKAPQNYGMNKLMLDLVQSIIRLTLWLYAVIFILQEVFHLGVTHLIASAGIVGLAVAFAAKDTIANIFGAFSILGGKMFRVGDWIKTGATEGIVEQIGFRSIRIRAFDDGRLIDIPNHVIADAQIENFSKRLYWREHFCFELAHLRTPDQMTRARQILKEIGKDLASLMAEKKPLEFDFILFDKDALRLDGYVWFKASDWLAMRHARSRFNEEVLKRLGTAGLVVNYSEAPEAPEKK